MLKDSSNQENFTQKWAIISLLDKVNEQETFLYSDFPLHITFAGVFKIDKPGTWLVKDLTKILEDQKQFKVVSECIDYFGPNKDIPVMKIKKTDVVMDYYRKIHSWLVVHNAIYNSPEYEGSGYIPHSTIQKNNNLKPVEERLLDSISIIDMFPEGNGYMRRIFKTIKLKTR